MIPSKGICTPAINLFYIHRWGA